MTERVILDPIDDLSIEPPTTIIKRDGRIVDFDVYRIEHALTKCFASFGRRPHTHVAELAQRVVNIIAAKSHGKSPTVEEVQDTVEMVLQAAGEFEAAKRYILYRAEHAKEREVRPIPAEIRQAFDESDRYFPTALQKFQFFDKYSRFDYELGRRETWIETVDRSVSFLREISQNKLDDATYDRVRTAILEMRAMPSMRLLAMAGPAARRTNIAIYNCSYMPVDSIDSFVEALIISMSGCGVGFSVENKYVEQFPRIKRQTGKPAIQYTVEDSAEGWAEALRFGLQTWFDGGDVQFDLSQLRPAGAPLRIKGGRASGPEPFRQMLDFCRSRILSRQGSFLRSLDAHDMMCSVGSAAVSGGVRRTAMISLFDYDDHDMLHSKDGDFDRDNSQRWNANNSAVWPAGGLTQLEIAQQVLTMVESGRGEPGIFNRQGTIDMRPERRKAAEFGTNPCVTGDTWVLTNRGPRQVVDLIGMQHTSIIDGKAYQTTEQGFWETGFKQVLHLQTEEGYNLRLTENHKVLAVPYMSRKTERFEWMEAGKLRPGDQIKLHNHRSFVWDGEGNEDEGWLLGSLVGDGTFDQKTARLVFWGEHRQKMADYAVQTLRYIGKTRSDFQGHDQVDHNRTIVAAAALRDLAQDYGIYHGNKRITFQIEATSSAFHQGFLRGLFDADGSVIGTQNKGVSVRLAQSDLELLHAVQRMLLRLGIASTIYDHRRPAGLRLLPDGHGGSKEYECRADHELVISNDNLQLFASTVGFKDPDKKQRLDDCLDDYKRIPNRERFVVTVKSIQPDGEELVYDCSVPNINAFDANGLYVHNCGEIILRGMQFCNLTAAVARADDTFETLREKVEVATIIGTIQSMATHFPGLRPQWKENCEEERLLGVDITGQMDSPVAQDPDVQRKLRQIAVDVNKEYAAKLGINQSVSVSCVKPSGNSSQLLDCSSGLHARWAPYYIRNVRVSSHSPIYKVLRDAGVPMDPENGQTRDNATTWVIHFPVKAPEGAITRNSRTAIEQCNYWLQNKLNWTEHNPSCFTQDTRFVTSEGLQSFADFADGQEVTVLNSKGQWTQATVQHFADQEIWELVVERCQAKHTIRTTANHLWPFTSPMRRFRHTNTTFLRTDELTRYAGSSTYKLVTVNPSEKVNMELEGILHGITYGDGTKHKSTQGRKEFCQVYLCNDPNGVDSRELAPLFIEAGYEIIDREDMQQIRIYSLPNHWKELPALELGSEYLRGFIAGWFAADGHVDHRGGTVLLSSVHIESLQWLQRVAPVAGIATSTHIGEHHTESTFGPVTWYSITLSKESLDRDFFLLESKRNRFDTAHFAKYWKIVSIQPTGTYAPVSCVQVPNDEQFVLEGNILTHNCTITYKPDEVMDMMKWIWEHREVIGGMAFLPSFDANYAQLPYMEIGKDEYEKLAAEFPPIDFSKIYRYEEEDLTTAAQELACMSGSCEVDFL